MVLAGRWEITTNEAKKDMARRLNEAGIPFTRLSSETVSFEGFGYGKAVFVNVHGATLKKGVGLDPAKIGIPKPSEGGYVPHVGDNATWEN